MRVMLDAPEFRRNCSWRHLNRKIQHLYANQTWQQQKSLPVGPAKVGCWFSTIKPDP
jgi:hypothetical protein